MTHELMSDLRIREDSESSDIILSEEAQAALIEFLRVYQFRVQRTHS